MRTYTYILASSARISSTANLLFPSTASQRIDFSTNYAMQCNFSGPSPIGTLRLLASNVDELPMFSEASSAFVSSSGSVLFNVLVSSYEFVRVSFATSGTSSTGFLTVVLQSKGF